MPAYYGETANSCRLEECLLKASDMIGWKEKGMRNCHAGWKDPCTRRCHGNAGIFQFPTVTSVLSR